MLYVSRVSIDDTQDLMGVSTLLDTLPQQTMNEVPWPTYPYKPAVQFAIAHDDNNLFLKYTVTEKAIRAVNSQINGSVWEDSCVEFFISLDDTAYYNFEFNCIGTALAGYGPSRTQRSLLPETLVEQIATRSVMDRLDDKSVHWALTVRIPRILFIHHQPLTLSGLQPRANFYKCGDLLPEPHFITWSGIQTPAPDFHVPESFGQLHIE